MPTNLRIFVLITLLGVSPVSSGEADPWPQFRGPDGMGHSAAVGLPIEWSESKNVVWKTPIPGTGWSSPVIRGGQIWFTTATVEPASEKERQAAEKGKTFPVEVARNLKLFAVCVSLDTGKVLHQLLLMEEPTPAPIHTLNSFASPTPVIEPGRVYCHFGDSGTVCVDTNSAKVVWKNRQLRLDHGTGAGSSPVLWNDLLIAHCDGMDVQYVAALNTNDGSLAWKTDRSGELKADPDMRKAFCTPLVMQVNGREVLISPAADWIYGYDPRTGEELWKVAYGALGFSTTPRPIVGRGFIYTCTGFMRSQLLAMSYDPNDILVPPTISWRYDKQVPTVTSPILVEDTLYFVSERGGVLTALDTATGNRRWQQRLGGNYSASPLYADGHIYVCSREGICTVFSPGREFTSVAENELEGSFMASPAVTGNALILRTDQSLYRIQTLN